MKLVDILVREIDMWPYGIRSISQNKSGSFCYFKSDYSVHHNTLLLFWKCHGSYYSSIHCYRLAEDYDSTVVTKDQWVLAKGKLNEEKRKIKWSLAPSDAEYWCHADGISFHYLKEVGGDVYFYVYDDVTSQPTWVKYEDRLIGRNHVYLSTKRPTQLKTESKGPYSYECFTEELIDLFNKAKKELGVCVESVRVGDNGAEISITTKRAFNGG